MKKIDAKRIRRVIEERKVDRAKTSVYVSKSLYGAFKAMCEPLSASEVLEEMMRDFVSSDMQEKGESK